MKRPKIHNFRTEFISAQTKISTASKPNGSIRPKFINPPSPVRNSLLRVRSLARKISVSARAHARSAEVLG